MGNTGRGLLLGDYINDNNWERTIRNIKYFFYNITTKKDSPDSITNTVVPLEHNINTQLKAHFQIPV